MKSILPKLTDKELEHAEIIANAFNGMRRGKQYLKSSGYYRDILKKSKYNIDISEPTFRKIVQYLRLTEKVNYIICSSSQGYWVASNKDEADQSEELLQLRLDNVTATLEAHRKQCRRVYGYEREHPNKNLLN